MTEKKRWENPFSWTSVSHVKGERKAVSGKSHSPKVSTKLGKCGTEKTTTSKEKASYKDGRADEERMRRGDSGGYVCSVV